MRVLIIALLWSKLPQARVSGGVDYWVIPIGAFARCGTARYDLELPAEAGRREARHDLRHERPVPVCA